MHSLLLKNNLHIPKCIKKPRPILSLGPQSVSFEYNLARTPQQTWGPGCNLPPSPAPSSQRWNKNVTLMCPLSLDELGHKYAKKEALHWWQKRGEKKRQSRMAAVFGWTINLCLFQSALWPKRCKIRVGMSSISVSASVPFCVGRRAPVMDWFCHLCSVHSMLTWKGRAGLWREAY